MHLFEELPQRIKDLVIDRGGNIAGFFAIHAEPLAYHLDKHLGTSKADNNESGFLRQKAGLFHG